MCCCVCALVRRRKICSLRVIDVCITCARVIDVSVTRVIDVKILYSRHLWIERVAGLTSVIELVFVFVESDGRVDLFRRSHWEVMGTIRLGWYCSRHLWIERVGFIFEFIVIESYCPE